jgi:two-component system, NarL family, invasion response regulator UvrY
MIPVLLVDDHRLFRHGVKQMLEAEGGFLVKEAGDLVEMEQSLQTQRFSVVVLDIELPGRSGLDAIGDLKRLHPQAGVVVLSMHSESRFGLRALKDGACAFMSKTVAPEELTAAIRAASRGERYVTPTLAQLLVAQLSEPEPGRARLRLSGRELEVLRQLSRGQRLSEIAAALDISVKTVSTYRARLLEKLGFSNNADLVRYVMAHPEVLRETGASE